jgi:CRP-like cAMP-binding protein
LLAKDKTPGSSAARTKAVSESALRANAIFEGLQSSDLAALTESAELIELNVRDTIYAAEESIDEVFFPIDSVLSVVTRMDEGGMIEVGTIGREGCSAIPLIMGAETTANDCYCQVPGRAIKIQAERFHELRDRVPAFRALLDRYLQAYVNFLGQLAGCNRLHTVYERSSRWLLMTHDRVGRDSISLTHEYLAMMLGSRRSGVSIALSTLRRAGYIAYSRGSIDILDRSGLEDTTCECYAVAQKQFGGTFRSGSGGHSH